jgi:DNA polymerase V
VTPNSNYRIPFFAFYVQAGFTSPAENYIERVCDLNDLCISNPEASYFVRVAGDSMIGDRIAEGDILIVNSAFDPNPKYLHGRIIIARLNEEYTVKRFIKADELIVLMPSNSHYLPIYVQPEDDFAVFGIVEHVIFKPSHTV